MAKLSKCKLLEMHYGGRWKYQGFVGWYSDDGRYVSAVSNGVDENDTPIGGPYRYHLYGNGHSEWVDWYQLIAEAAGKEGVSNA